ncbi:ribose-phosphate diphosphokinase, partial [Chlamydiota bacterium]
MKEQMREMKLFSGTANKKLSEEIGSYLSVQLGNIEIKKFPGGEIFCQFKEDIRGCDIFIIQPTCSPPNENIMELLIMIDTAKRASAARITAVIPFFGYARQDRKDRPRVPITAKLMANLITAAGADRVLTMDLHAEQIQGFFDIPVDHLYAAPVFIDYIKELQLDDLVIISPDVGGIKRARAFASRLGAGLAIVDKRRVDSTSSRVMHLIGEVENKPVLIVDDLVSTAGSITEAAKFLQERGCKAIYANVVHPILAGPAILRLNESPIQELVISNSIPIREDQESAKIK